MRISFFEEFPNTKNLRKLSLVNWDTKLYLAAKSLNEFNQIKNGLKAKEIIYWPILEKKEGYWISPFSQRKALQRILAELKGSKTSIMLDLELPTTKNPSLYLTQFLNFFRNKKLIREFIQNYHGKVYLAEYYPSGKMKDQVMTSLGLHFNLQQVKVIKMFYHSMHNFNKKLFQEALQKGRKKWGNNFIPSFGAIAVGIQGNESILTVKQLKNDLRLAKETGIEEVILFRLGGLNKEYLKMLRTTSQTLVA